MNIKTTSEFWFLAGNCSGTTSSSGEVSWVGFSMTTKLRVGVLLLRLKHRRDNLPAVSEVIKVKFAFCLIPGYRKSSRSVLQD